MVEVQPADPRARRAAFIVLGVGIAGGVLLVWLLEAARPAAAQWLKEDPTRTVARAQLLLAGLALVTSGPAIAAGAYLWRFGARIVSAERFPPPGVRMVQETVVLSGPTARVRGRLFQALGFILFAAGVAMALLLMTLAPH